MEKKELSATRKMTEHYGLAKSGTDDFYDVEVGNQNMDQVDAALKGLEDRKADQVAVDAEVKARKGADTSIGDRLGGLSDTIATALLPYSTNVTYPKSALVMSGGSIYCSAKDVNKGNPVTDEKSWSQYGEIVDECAPLPYEGKGYTMLYDHGDECVGVTGGWGYHSREDKGGGSGVKNIDNLLVSQMTSNYDCGGFFTNSKIDISEYDKYAVLCEQTNGYGSYNGWRGFGFSTLNVWGVSGQVGPTSTVVSNDESTQSPSKVTPKEILNIDINANNGNFFAFVGSVVAAVKFYKAFLLKSDDYQTWLTKAGLNPSSYPTLDSVVNNAAAMAALANSTKAVDYMIRCTGTIMGAVTNSTVAMTAIGKSEYAMDKIISSSDWTKFILMNPSAIAGLDASNPITVPTMTSNTMPCGVAKADACQNNANDEFKVFDDNQSTYWWMDVGTRYHWVEYMFEAPVWVYKCKILNSPIHTDVSGYLTKCKLQGSNDGINYVDITATIQVNPPISQTVASTTTFSQNNKTERFKYIRLQGIESYAIPRDLAANQNHKYDILIPTLQFYGKCEKYDRHIKIRSTAVY